MRLHILLALLLVLSSASATYGAQEDIVQRMKREHAEACHGRSKAADLQIGMERVKILGHKFWSGPDNMSKSTTAAGVTEVYRYECEGYQTVRLVIVNGKLSSIHQ